MTCSVSDQTIWRFSCLVYSELTMASTSSDNTELSVAAKVPFAELTGMLENISKAQGHEKKKLILKKFIDHWRENHVKLHENDSSTTNDSFYPAMRLILPHLEKERVAYGIKENTLAKLLIEVLCLGKNSPDGQKLLHYKAPKTARADAGDFANVAYFVLKNRCPALGCLTIQEVNNCLDAIAVNNSAKKKDLVRKNILHLLKNLSALEQKWLIRMIVKELKIGFSQHSVFSVYHEDAEELYNVNNSLEKVSLLLKDPSVRIHEIGITVFCPFCPMLGERASPNMVEKIMDGKSYFIETKYDGERMILHKDGDVYSYFSRSGNEYTNIFGSSPFTGTLTPFIVNCFKKNVMSCILDGEMLGYHSDSKTFGTKVEHFDIKSKALVDYQPCLLVFDVVLLNDKVLTNLPLRERLACLEKVFEPVEGRILISKHKVAITIQECMEALNDAIDNREEGIMVKKPDSVYKPNIRKGGWFKMKPEYVGGLMDELDVLIVGGYYGTGYRSGIMSHFLCAVAEPTIDDEEPCHFYSFCKVGTGYSKKELRDLNHSLANHWKEFDLSNPPKNVILASGFREKPDAWIEPSNSCIVQIKAAEIVESDKFKTGYTLRFPRVEKIRDDKPWTTCMTTSELEDIRQKSGGKLAARYMIQNDERMEEEIVKKRKKITVVHEKPTLSAFFRRADISNVEKVSNILGGKEFCVINGPSNFPKPDLEKKVVEFGGEIVQNPGFSTYCVLADKVAIRVNNLIKRNIYDIVKADWFIRCVNAQKWLPWAPGDMIHSSKNTERLFKQQYDQFGDSFTDNTTEEQLIKVFDRIEKTDYKRLTTVEIAEIEDAYFPEDCSYALFRLYCFYLDNNRILGDASSHIQNSSLDLLALELRFFGATVLTTLDDSVSHVIVDDRDLSRLKSIHEVRRQKTKKFHIVTTKWVRQCFEESAICPESSFTPAVQTDGF